MLGSCMEKQEGQCRKQSRWQADKQVVEAQGGTCVRAAFETNVKASRNPTLANLDVSKYFLVLVSLRFWDWNVSLILHCVVPTSK